MKKRICMWLVIGLAGALLGPGSSAETYQRAVSDDDYMLVCKKVRVVGSRIRREVCTTKSRAVEERKMGQQSVENMKRELDDIRRIDQRPTYDQRVPGRR